MLRFVTITVVDIDDASDKASNSAKRGRGFAPF